MLGFGAALWLAGPLLAFATIRVPSAALWLCRITACRGAVPGRSLVVHIGVSYYRSSFPFAPSRFAGCGPGAQPAQPSLLSLATAACRVDAPQPHLLQVPVWPSTGTGVDMELELGGHTICERPRCSGGSRAPVPSGESNPCGARSNYRCGGPRPSLQLPGTDCGGDDNHDQQDASTTALKNLCKAFFADSTAVGACLWTWRSL